MLKGKWIILAIAYCGILLGAWLSSYLEFDFSLTTLSARSSEEFRNYQTYSKRFPVDDDGLVLSVGSNSKLNSENDFAKLERLRLDLLSLEGVEGVLGITSVELPEKSLFGTKSRTLLQLGDEGRFTKSFKRLSDYPDVTPKFLSESRCATRLFLDVDWSKASLNEIKKCTRKYDYSEVHFMGKEVFAQEIEENIASETRVLPLAAGVILLLLFFMWFRDLKSLVVVASLLALNLSLVSVLFYVCGIKIGILTSTAPLLILVLSFSDIVHIIYRFKQLPDGSTEERVRDTIAPLKLPLWLTTLTTGVAFALFFVSGIAEIMEFALCTCLGIIMAYLTARHLLPTFILCFRIRPFKRKSAFDGVAHWLIGARRFYKPIVIGSVVLFVLVAVGLMCNFKINSSFHQSFGADTEIGKSLRFNDKNFEGVRTIEVILETNSELNENIVRTVDSIERELIDKYGCRSVFSVNTAIKRLNRYNHFGKTAMYVIPETIDQDFLADLYQNQKELGLVNAMTKDRKLFRIVGRIPDIGSAKSADKNLQLEARLKELESEECSIFISGFSYVKDKSTNRITILILIGIGLSLIIATCVIGTVFRSVKIALIALFPNVLPVVFGLALMIWMGIELNPTTAMALSIILGLALDDTIYFLSSIKRSQSVDKSERVKESLHKNTFPAAVTSLILMIGFGALLFSSVESNRNIGFLVATMLLIALISDLIILPAMLYTFWAKKSES